jgi:propionyl-CoA synthetase
VILQRPMCEAEITVGRDHDWPELTIAARPVDCLPVPASDPLYILYTSGTTGIPKGVVRDNGGHGVALHWSLRNIYGVKSDEVFWTASDVGWVVGNSFIVYAPLLLGCTTVMYEGKPVGTPDAGTFWWVIDQHRVRVFFTAPTAFRAIKREDPDGRLIRRRDLKEFRALFLVGERADPPTVAWAEEQLRIPVIDHWWQTETGWPIGANCLGIERLPVKHGSCTRGVPGWEIRVLDAEAEGEVPERKAGEIGALAVKLTLPPGALPTLCHADEKFIAAYLSVFPGFYQTTDAGFIDEDGYIHVMTRTDDIINVAAHRLSTGEIEEVLAAHPDVPECAVIGVTDALKAPIPLGLLVLKAGVARPPDEIEDEVVRLVRDRIGPVTSFKTALVVTGLPKTRSGKILRGTMGKIAEGEDYPLPATIDDPAVLGEVDRVLAAAGYANR